MDERISVKRQGGHNRLTKPHIVLHLVLSGPGCRDHQYFIGSVVRFREGVSFSNSPNRFGISCSLMISSMGLKFWDMSGMTRCRYVHSGMKLLTVMSYTACGFGAPASERHVAADCHFCIFSKT